MTHLGRPLGVAMKLRTLPYESPKCSRLEDMRFAWKAEAAQRKTGVPATWAMNASEPVTYAGRE